MTQYAVVESHTNGDGETTVLSVYGPYTDLDKCKEIANKQLHLFLNEEVDENYRDDFEVNEAGGMAVASAWDSHIGEGRELIVIKMEMS